MMFRSNDWLQDVCDACRLHLSLPLTLFSCLVHRFLNIHSQERAERERERKETQTHSLTLSPKEAIERYIML